MNLNPEQVVYVWVFMGLLARVIFPYLNAMQEGKLPKWEAKFLLPPVMSCVIALVTLPLVLGQMPAESMSYFAAFAFGWANTDMSRFVQKAVAGMVVLQEG